MKKFYETYASDEFVTTLLSQISWSNHLAIISKAKSEEERHFYISLCIKENYSARELSRQIDSSYYERYMLSKEKLLVFFSSKKLMEKVSKRLELMSSGLKFAKYFGGTNTDEAAKAKENAFRLFSEGEVNILLATSAFGMGVDIGDIRHIIHVGFPLTMLDYIQQCGRGGRDGMGCEYKLYASLSDIKRCGRLISSKQLKMHPMSRCIKIQQKGRIISALFGSAAISSLFFAPSIIKASLYPVRMPLYILIFQSFKGVPIASIFLLIDCSMGERITQLAELSKRFSTEFC